MGTFDLSFLKYLPDNFLNPSCPWMKRCEINVDAKYQAKLNNKFQKSVDGIDFIWV